MKRYWLGLTVCLALLGVAYFYFQQHLGLAPCPLCMLQRACLGLIALFCLLGLLLRPKFLGQTVLSVLILLSSLTGVAVAARQVWLQSLPADQVPECGPDLMFMLENFPLSEVLNTVLYGSGSCAEVQWQWLGLSMPTWMVVIYAFMSLLAFCLLFKPRVRI